jgi:hypothetical protein
MLPEVPQHLRCPSLSLLGSVMLLDHFPNPAGAVQSFTKAIASVEIQFLQSRFLSMKFDSHATLALVALVLSPTRS